MHECSHSVSPDAVELFYRSIFYAAYLISLDVVQSIPFGIQDNACLSQSFIPLSSEIDIASQNPVINIAQDAELSSPQIIREDIGTSRHIRKTIQRAIILRQ